MTIKGNSAISTSEATFTDVMNTCKPPPKRVPRMLTTAMTAMTVIVMATRAQCESTSPSLPRRCRRIS